MTTDPDQAPSPQEAADRRFQEVLEETGARDPREFYRELLKELKTRDEDAFAAAVERWQSGVIQPLARGEGDPLGRWLAFGLELARTLHPGRTVTVDADGRAQPLEAQPDWRWLILHLPERKRDRAVPVSIPPEPTPAQQATLDLLVQGRLKLPET